MTIQLVKNVKPRSSFPYFCNHDRLKYCCIECGGSRICSHGKYKQYCKECNGSGLCVHDKRIHMCKDCGGNYLCRHGNRRSSCTLCKEDSRERQCKHNKVHFCRTCHVEKEMDRLMQEKKKNIIDKWKSNFIINHIMVKNCNEWCFYISDQDEIKKLRCRECKRMDLINNLNMKRNDKDTIFDQHLDFLINICDL